MKKRIFIIIFVLLLSVSTIYGKTDFKSMAEKALIDVGIYNMGVLNTTCKYIFESTTTLYILCKNNNNEKRLFIILRSNKNFFGANDPWYIIKIDNID